MSLLAQAAEAQAPIPNTFVALVWAALLSPDADAVMVDRYWTRDRRAARRVRKLSELALYPGLPWVHVKLKHALTCLAIRIAARLHRLGRKVGPVSAVREFIRDEARVTVKKREAFQALTPEDRRDYDAAAGKSIVALVWEIPARAISRMEVGDPALAKWLAAGKPFGIAMNYALIEEYDHHCRRARRRSGASVVRPRPHARIVVHRRRARLCHSARSPGRCEAGSDGDGAAGDGTIFAGRRVVRSSPTPTSSRYSHRVAS